MYRENFHQNDPKSIVLLKTEEAIFFIKQSFQHHLASILNLVRVSAPLFVERQSGMQDNLNGTEQAVSFNITGINDKIFEVVQSLAKWKRYALYRYRIPEGSGIYTDMNAIRPDEPTLDSNIHSVYVDQWDWEKVISAEERSVKTLEETVRSIYRAMKIVEMEVFKLYGITPFLPDEIRAIHADELYRRYPDLSSKGREDAICKAYGAVFIRGIGDLLPDGKPHDGRAPDYDDWISKDEDGKSGLNGDILVWNPILERSFELSSMGIRVNADSLAKQLKIRDCEERVSLPWHQLLLQGRLPQSIGGGLGQSRLCMLLLQKRHIGEVQVGAWPNSVETACRNEKLMLL